MGKRLFWRVKNLRAGSPQRDGSSPGHDLSTLEKIAILLLKRWKKRLKEGKAGNPHSLLKRPVYAGFWPNSTIPGCA
jgi:hypothetical protein